jgi:hypothetical protein
MLAISSTTNGRASIGGGRIVNSEAAAEAARERERMEALLREVNKAMEVKTFEKGLARGIIIASTCFTNTSLLLMLMAPFDRLCI